MATDQEKQPKQRVSIWYIVIPAAVFLMMFFGTLTSGGFAVLVSAARTEYGLGGTESSLMFTVKNISAFLFVMVATKYYEKIGVRLGISLAFVYAAIAMLICMMAGSNITMYYVGAAILGSSYAFTMILPMAIIIQRWFNKKRAFVLAIVASATGFSGLLATPVQQMLITATGISGCFQATAAAFLVFAVVFFLMMRNNPSDVGLEPYGGVNFVESPDEGKKKRVELVPAKKTITVAVLGFTLCAFITGFCSPPSQQHFLMQFANIGYADVLATSAYAILSGVLLCSKLGLGALSTRFPYQYVSAFFLLCYVASLVLCGVAGYMGVISWMPFLICGIFGVAGAINTLGYPNWIADFAARDDYPKRVRNAQLAYQGGEMIGSFIPGVIMDVAGSYSPWYFIAAACYMVSMTIVLKNYGSRKKMLAAVNAETSEEKPAA